MCIELVCGHTLTPSTHCSDLDLFMRYLGHGVGAAHTIKEIFRGEWRRNARWRRKRDNVIKGAIYMYLVAGDRFRGQRRKDQESRESRESRRYLL